MTTYIATTSGGEIDGSAGNDVMIGKSGDDTFDGGTGSDILLGGAGNDFIYYDEFDIKVDGGTGYDTLVFDGSGQTLNLGLQKTVMNFEQIDLAGSGGHQLFFSAADIIRAADNDKMRIWGDSTNTVTFNDSGWSFSGFNSGGLALFSNGGATIEVQIGLHISSFSGNSIITAQIGSDQTVTEDESTPNLSATGHFDVSDVDGQNYLTTFVAKKAGSIGSLSLTPHASIPGVSTGQYTYSVNNNLTQYLGIAEKQIDEFTVTSIDGSTETFKFTIVGVNDAAFRNAQTNDSVTGSVQEFADGQLGENTFASTINGSFVVKDVDRGDNLYSWMISGALTRGSLTSVSIGTADIDGNRTISWTYILDDSHLDSLAEGGKATDVFTLRLSDRPEGTAGGDFFDQVITINQAGANDAPVRIAQTGDKVEGSVTEPAAGGAISDTTVIGKFVVQDVDISDQLFYWIETAVQVHGSLSTVSIDAADDDGNRIINWTYLIEGNKLNSLAEGINPADIFTLRISDRPQGMPGASVLSQDIQISLSGENDAPVRINQSSDVLKGSATENEDGTSGENTQFEIIKGSYFVKDVDLGDDLFYWVESTYPTRGTIYNVEFGNPSEDGSRKVTWSYYIEDHSLDSLDEISKVIDTFSLKISDHPEGTANATVLTDTITIDLFGNNDAPTIIIQQGDKIGGSVTELPSGDPNADSSYLHKVSGSFHIQEVDDVDILLNSEIVHTSTNSTLYGKLVIDSISGRDPNNNGLQVVNWTYSVTDEALDPLSDGSGSTQTFAISLTDGRATVVQNVTVELIGSAEPIIGDNNANTLDGTAGADLISGLGGIDTINGFAGDDIIYGGSGDDIISGGGGNDTIFGGDGNDEIVGGAGINNINGDDGNDSFGIEYSGGTIHGGAGFDEFSFLSDWGQADGASLRVYGDAGGDNYYFRVNEVENKSFGINIADFDPSEDSIVFFISKFKTPQSFKATLSSPDTVTITYASGTATVDICSLTFVGASPGTVDSSWLSNMVTFS